MITNTAWRSTSRPRARARHSGWRQISVSLSPSQKLRSFAAAGPTWPGRLLVRGIVASGCNRRISGVQFEIFKFPMSTTGNTGPPNRLREVTVVKVGLRRASAATGTDRDTEAAWPTAARLVHC